MGVRWLAGLLAGALALAGCSAGESPARDWPAPAPALWEVRGPEGGQAEAWLFGTVHALPEGIEWRTPAIDQALAQSGLLVVEVANLDDARAAAQAFAARARTPGLPPLLTRVSPADRPALSAALAEAGLSEESFEGVESWAAALQLANALRRYDSANGVDRALIDGAARVIGLETLDRQFALFDALPVQAQARLLVAVAREGNAALQDDLIAAWLIGDMAALEREAADGLLADPVLRRTLQTARNRAWSERIAGLIEAGERPFVAVGAAHLPGAEGLVALLEARGFSLRRVQ